MQIGVCLVLYCIDIGRSSIVLLKSYLCCPVSLDASRLYSQNHTIIWLTLSLVHTIQNCVTVCLAHITLICSYLIFIQVIYETKTFSKIHEFTFSILQFHTFCIFLYFRCLIFFVVLQPTLTKKMNVFCELPF
jgi:hypothetical protein